MVLGEFCKKALLTICSKYILTLYFLKSTLKPHLPHFVSDYNKFIIPSPQEVFITEKSPHFHFHFYTREHYVEYKKSPQAILILW